MCRGRIGKHSSYRDHRACDNLGLYDPQKSLGNRVKKWPQEAGVFPLSPSISFFQDCLLVYNSLSLPTSSLCVWGGERHCTLVCVEFRG